MGSVRSIMRFFFPWMKILFRKRRSPKTWNIYRKTSSLIWRAFWITENYHEQCVYHLHSRTRSVGASRRPFPVAASEGAVSGSRTAVSPNVLREEILHIFADLTGELPEPGKHYYVDQFAKTQVGMSTGWISGDFWQATAIPLLMERLEQTDSSKEYVP